MQERGGKNYWAVPYIFICSFIYLTALGLNCLTQDLCCFTQELLLRPADSSCGFWAQCWAVQAWLFCSVWNLSSLIRDGTCAPCIARQIFFLMYLLFLPALGLHCYVWVFSSCSKQRLLSSCHVWASLVAEHGLQGAWTSAAVAHGLSSCVVQVSCPAARGLFPDQGWNLCRLHWWWILNHWTTWAIHLSSKKGRI